MPAEYLILSSTDGLARDLIDALTRQSNPAAAAMARTHSVLEIDGAQAASILQSNREALVQGDMVKKGKSRTEAEAGIDLFISLMGFLDQAKLSMGTRQQPDADPPGDETEPVKALDNASYSLSRKAAAMMMQAKTPADPKWAWATYEPDAGRPWNLRLAAHLYRRAAFGADWTQLRQAISEGPQRTVDRLLRPQVDVDAFSRAYDEQESIAAGSIGGLRAWWLRRMIETPHPLLEKMVLFWHSHFATSAAGLKDPRLMQQHVRLLRIMLWARLQTCSGQSPVTRPRSPGSAPMRAARPCLMRVSSDRSWRPSRWGWGASPMRISGKRPELARAGSCSEGNSATSRGA